ncbi:LytR/AlgR family response regulator transcription factor [Pedobacter jeongneungensis]|uniref:LytR/AlgR family response regulator transcription factor n=1 Tax=Pedobacter jeongneungensis TaxID=947309 RepID=UPI0004695A6A|nr:response regulator [Pedobacter jeongneungensis]
MKSTSNKWSCAVVDDDATMVAILESYISQIPKLELVGSYTDPKEALNRLGHGQEVDFLFLDIKMEISGLDIARMLRNKINHIIFITAYKQFALEAFQVHCDHYLVKPVDFSKFLTAINDVVKRKRRQEILTEKLEIKETY